MPDTANPGSVKVAAVSEPVFKATAENDCCAFCDEQVLEALRPTATGPVRTEEGGGLPRRRKLCGRVVGYGVNDETTSSVADRCLHTEITPADQLAPRELTFRFPFRFPRTEAPRRACLRHVRAPRIGGGGDGGARRGLRDVH